MGSEMQSYEVYVRTDNESRILAVNCGEYLSSTDGWTLIDTGYSDKYHHAQANYFDMALTDERGVCRYKLVDGKAMERTQEEMDADWTEPTPDLDLATQVAELRESNRQLQEALDLLLSGEVE